MSKHLIRPSASVQIGGTWYGLGAFRTVSELSFTSSRRKSTPAAGEREVARRGRKSIDDVTVARENNTDANLVDWLRQNRGCEMVVSYQQLDDDLNPWGKPISVPGRLADVMISDGDAEATDEPADFRLVMSPHGD